MKVMTEEELKKALRAKKLDAGLRQKAVEFARAAVAGGATVTGTAARLGMKANTLHRWHQRAAKAKLSAVKFIEVAGVPAAEGLEVVWPTGHLVRMSAGDLKSVFMALEATCCPRG